MIVTASDIFAQANYETINGLRYLLDANTQKATLVANPVEKYSGSITVPEKITATDKKEYAVVALGDECFNDCRDLYRITLPSSIASLGAFCFSECSNLTNITIPSSVTSLGNSCFSSCSNLTTISIPSSVTSLGEYCFGGCSNLTTITIPSSVTSLGENCFGDSPKLESIKFLGKTLDGLAISGISPTCVFYVPKEYLEDYMAAVGKTFPYITAWNGSEEKPTVRCEVPTITYAAGKLRFKSSTLGAKYYYTITDSDMATDAYSQDGAVTLVAAYKISAYATAEGYQPSETATATLYWINANLENDPSTNINQSQTRGIVATSDGGIVTLSGLDNGELVSFYSPDGRLVATSKAQSGTVSCSVNSSMVIAKVSNQSIKLIVKQ